MAKSSGSGGGPKRGDIRIVEGDNFFTVQTFGINRANDPNGWAINESIIRTPSVFAQERDAILARLQRRLKVNYLVRDVNKVPIISKKKG